MISFMLDRENDNEELVFSESVDSKASDSDDLSDDFILDCTAFDYSNVNKCAQNNDSNIKSLQGANTNNNPLLKNSDDVNLAHADEAILYMTTSGLKNYNRNGAYCDMEIHNNDSDTNNDSNNISSIPSDFDRIELNNFLSYQWQLYTNFSSSSLSSKSSNFSPNAGSFFEEACEVVSENISTGNLRVLRKIYIAKGFDYARHLVLFENPTSQSITIPVKVDAWGNSSYDVAIIPSDDVRHNIADHFVVLDSSFSNFKKTTVTHDDRSHTLNANDIDKGQFDNDRQNQNQFDLTVPAKNRAVLIYFLIQNTDDIMTISDGKMVVSQPELALFGMSEEKVFLARNFNLTGDTPL